MKDDSHIKKMITDVGLKVTPQRLMVLRALYEMNNHPSADQVLEFIRRTNPHMGTGTVYNILEVFADKGVIKRVKSEKGILRYDAIRESHHHLYCTDTEKIEDYYDNELSELLDDYFRKRRIQGFEIDEISLHIIGKYSINRKN
jgi:Fur family transcriptional regulator, peroxide stress response regulator